MLKGDHQAHVSDPGICVERFCYLCLKRSNIMSQSEVAILRKKILKEYEAMKRGLPGIALGNSRHAFIDARLKSVDNYHSQLALFIGEQEATLTICELYTQVMD